MIEKLIEEEDKKNHYQIKNIADKLKKSGVNISRRTVAKIQRRNGN